MRVLKILGLSLTMALAAGANAASLTLVYTGDNEVSDDGTIAAAVGDLITLDLIMDFSGPDERTLGGGFDIVFDATAFEFVEYVRADLGEPEFGRSPDVEEGRLVSGAFGSFNGLTGPDLVASITFRLLAAPPGQYDIVPDETMGIGGPFWGADIFVMIEPDFFGVSVGLQPVPVPAAVWFLSSGLLALFGVRRRGTGQPTLRASRCG